MSQVLYNREHKTLDDVTTEFLHSVKDMKSGSKDADMLAKHFEQLERTSPNDPVVIQQVRKMYGIEGNDGYTSPFLVNCQPRISNMALAYVAMQVGQIPEMFTTMIGLYCYEFYRTHPRTDEMTFTWMMEQSGGMKLINVQMMFPWALYCRNTDQRNWFEVMTADDLYRYGITD